MPADFLSPNIYRQSEKEKEENKSVSKICHVEMSAKHDGSQTENQIPLMFGHLS